MVGALADFGVAQERDVRYDSDALRIGLLLIQGVRLAPKRSGRRLPGLTRSGAVFRCESRNPSETERTPNRRERVVQSFDPRQTRTQAVEDAK